MLKSEVRKLYEDRNAAKKTLTSNEKSASIMERKYTIAKEMLDKTTSEKQKLLKSNFNLKKRADQLEAKLNANKIKEEILVKKGIRNNPSILSLTHSDIRSITPQTQGSHTWQSILYSTSENQLGRDPLPSAVTNPSEKSKCENQLIADVPDFDGLRLKIDSLAHEREFLKNENELLKVRLEELTKKIVVLEKKVSESNANMEKITKNLDCKSLELDNAFKKYERAEKIAANLENQYKVEIIIKS